MNRVTERLVFRNDARGRRARSCRMNRRPTLEALEDRLVLSTTPLDLTGPASFGFINGALFRQGSNQPSGTGVFQSFVRIQNDGTEQGYNTDGSPQFDTKGGSFTHAVLLSTIPLKVINGEAYREFNLDINQTGKEP
ncbi:MAG TPA: LEPR-XLL domain-containing protein, partial [Isosphaeraceae bacterium]|nr:LEPR-XLL domain-containing protein [Isosphaeraceae bacterium]